MASKPTPRRGPKPTVSERVERVRAAASPKLEQAAAQAAPKVEKAAQAAGTFFGTLRDRAKETAKQFSEGYGAGDDDPAARSDDDPAARSDDAATPVCAEEPAARPRPRPRPGPRAE